MPKHTDRGLVVFHDEADGSTSLSICARVVDGRPADVYAQYFHAKVKIDDDVALTRLGASRYTDQIVEVTSRDNKVVTVRYPKYDPLP
jgi:hypothetical protein